MTCQPITLAKSTPHWDRSIKCRGSAFSPFFRRRYDQQLAPRWQPQGASNGSRSGSPAAPVVHLLLHFQRAARLLEERGDGCPTVTEVLALRSPRSLKEWLSKPIGDGIVAGADLNAPTTVPHGHFVVERWPEVRVLKDLGVWTSVAKCRIEYAPLTLLSNPHIAHCFAAYLTVYSYFTVADCL